MLSFKQLYLILIIKKYFELSLCKLLIDETENNDSRYPKVYLPLAKSNLHTIFSFII